MLLSRNDTQEKPAAFALVIVLAFVVLLTGLVLAYFTRATTDRQAANSSSRQIAADELALSALNIVVADFRQEIINGSTGAPAPDIYEPSAPENVVPVRNGNPPDVPNLIRRSIRSDTIISPALSSRGSAVNASDQSINGRSVGVNRWNSHFLIPKANLSNDQPQPIASFVAPDWVLVSRNGPAERAGIGSGSSALNDASPGNAAFVVGRYAFAVYDEGGLLDINVAGYPVAAAAPPDYARDVGRKGVLALADLTALPTVGSSFVTTTAINRLVGWRYYATIEPTGTFPALVNTTAGASAFLAHVLGQTRDFRTVATKVVGAGTTRRTDQSFLNRAELIRLRSSSGAGTASMLQYLGTFSRSLNRPTLTDAATRLANRFPLSRFDLLTDPIGKAADIQKYFGLQYVAATTGPPALPERWRYVGTSGSTVLSSIPTLSGNGQDPELPVLMKYALSGVSDAEILSVVASLIDQRDTNDDTTWVEYGTSAAPQRAYGADKNASTQPGAPTPTGGAKVLNRSFRTVGELGYAYKSGTTSLDFSNASSLYAPLLDLFTYNTVATRSGLINLNTRNPAPLAALLKGAITTETTNPSPTVVTNTTANPNAMNAATSIAAETAVRPAFGRPDVTRLASPAVVGNPPFTTGEEHREAIVRALAEVGQTRTWGLLIDVIAQSGRYPQAAQTLADFVVEAEKRYWLHVAIDRFTGEIIDQQLEAANE